MTFELSRVLFFGFCCSVVDGCGLASVVRWYGDGEEGEVYGSTPTLAFEFMFTFVVDVPGSGKG